MLHGNVRRITSRPLLHIKCVFPQYGSTFHYLRAGQTHQKHPRGFHLLSSRNQSIILTRISQISQKARRFARACRLCRVFAAGRHTQAIACVICEIREIRVKFNHLCVKILVRLPYRRHPWILYHIRAEVGICNPLIIAGRRP